MRFLPDASVYMRTACTPGGLIGILAAGMCSAMNLTQSSESRSSGVRSVRLRWYSRCMMGCRHALPRTPKHGAMAKRALPKREAAAPLRSSLASRISSMMAMILLRRLRLTSRVT